MKKAQKSFLSWKLLFELLFISLNVNEKFKFLNFQKFQNKKKT